ncbi:MAG: hypothetical protein Q7R78_01750 [bacterium]|nr:hypothetical protein [bacterium]
MKNIQKIFTALLVVISILTTNFNVFAQEGVTLLSISIDNTDDYISEGVPVIGGDNGGGGGGTPVTNSIPVPPDLSMLTNTASLAAWAMHQVKGIAIDASMQSSVYEPFRYFTPFTNSIKTLDTASELVSNFWFSFKVTNPQDYLSIRIRFVNTSTESGPVAVNEKGGGQEFQQELFYGYGGGQAEKDRWGNWTLPESASQVPMYLAGNIFIPVPDLQSAKLVTRDQYGNPQANSLSCGNGGFWFQSGKAGNGELILTTARLENDGYWHWYNNAYSLTNASEIPMTWVSAHAIIAGSEDIRSFNGSPTNIDVLIWTYSPYDDGTEYGKTPLIMATYTEGKKIYLSTRTQYQYATAFEIQDQQTMVKTTIVVPPEQQGVAVNMPPGAYYIIPLGLKFIPYPWYYGGGKG